METITPILSPLSKSGIGDGLISTVASFDKGGSVLNLKLKALSDPIGYHIRLKQMQNKGSPVFPYLKLFVG